LTVVLTFVGVFLYSVVINIGYSFVIWAGFAIFMLLAGIFSAIPNQSPRQRWVPIFCAMTGIILAVVAFATAHWYSETSNLTFIFRQVTVSNAGVQVYSYDQSNYDPNSGAFLGETTLTSCFSCSTFDYKTINPGSPNTDQTITKCPGNPNGGQCYMATTLEKGQFQAFIGGGQKAMGCGIPALIFAALAAVAIGTLFRGSGNCCSGGPPQHAKVIAVAFSLVASALAFLGLFLYAAITSVGVSFVLYSIAGFMWVLAFCLGFGEYATSAGGVSSGGGFSFGNKGTSSPRANDKPSNTTEPTTPSKKAEV